MTWFIDATPRSLWRQEMSHGILIHVLTERILVAHREITRNCSGLVYLVDMPKQISILGLVDYAPFRGSNMGHSLIAAVIIFQN